MKIVFRGPLLGTWEGSGLPVCPVPPQEAASPIPCGTGGAVDDSTLPFHHQVHSRLVMDGLATQACQSQ